MSYRLLRAGELIQAADEVQQPKRGLFEPPWQRVTEAVIDIPATDPSLPYQPKYRRPAEASDEVVPSE